MPSARLFTHVAGGKRDGVPGLHSTTCLTVCVGKRGGSLQSGLYAAHECGLNAPCWQADQEM